jgi:hypothetical protein
MAYTEFDGVDVELPRGSSITGTISGASAVEGSFVSACRADTCDGGSSVAEDGSYAIHGLVPDVYRLSVEPPDMPSDLLDGWYTPGGPVANQDDASDIDVSAGDASGIDLSLVSGHRISGTVTVTGVGAPAGIEVRALGESSEAGLTVAGGAFEIRGLRDGNYTLTVAVPETLDGLSGPVVSGAVASPEADGTEIVVSGANVTGQAITTARGRRMSGRLTGSGAAGGRVTALGPDMERSATIEPDGDWLLRGLRPGAYGLVFQREQSDDGFESLFPLGYWDGAGALTLDDAAATTITVAGVDMTGRNASVPTAATLAGTVRALDGSPLEDAFVLACADLIGCVSRLTGPDGSWAFAGAPPGDYLVQVWHARHPGGWYGLGGFAEDEAHAATITVGTASVGPIRVVLPDGGAISGTVADPDGAPIQDVLVSGSDGSGLPPVPPGQDSTAADGSYRIEGLRPGTWMVGFTPSENAPFLPGYSDVGAGDGYATDVDDATSFVIEGPEGLSWVPIEPERIVDSRTPVGVSGPFLTSVPRSFPVAGVGGIPLDALAVTGNVTVVGQTAAGYVSVGPTMSATPTSSTVNVPVGDVRANNVTLPLSDLGRLAAVYKGPTGSKTHLIVDISGYFVAGTDEATYATVAPTRVLDSRPGQDIGLSDPFMTGVPRTLSVAGDNGIPNAAVAVTANLTVVSQTSAGYLSVTPTPQANPTTSTLNVPKGDIRANGLTAPLDGSGDLSIVWKGSPGGTAHMILDVTGYYLEDPGGLLFYPVTPGRVLDTRTPSWASGLTGTFLSGTPRSLRVGGHAFLPASVSAVTGNLTIVGQTAAGYVSVTPDPTANPTTSTLNVPKSDVRANGVTVPVDAGGDDLALVYKAASGARTHLILDLTGYFD